MIKVNIDRDKKGFIRGFQVKGHAGYAGHGEDIVCAAVSAIAYTAVGALQELAGIGNYSEKNGYMRSDLPEHMDKESHDKAQIILEAMAIGFKQVEQSYDKYVSVVDEEV